MINKYEHMYCSALIRSRVRALYRPFKPSHDLRQKVKSLRWLANQNGRIFLWGDAKVEPGTVLVDRSPKAVFPLRRQTRQIEELRAEAERFKAEMEQSGRAGPLAAPFQGSEKPNPSNRAARPVTASHRPAPPSGAGNP